MKEIMKKISEHLKTVFGYGVLITLILGALSFFAYAIALIVGGDAAALICDFTYNVMLKITVYASTVVIIIGILAMYLAGEKALTSGRKTKK